jgi:prevent-host-death family protein
MPGAAGVSELKAKLSEYLARVKAGEEVVVTERGRPVARLVPVGFRDGKDRDRLIEMERAGEIRLGPGGVPPDFWEMPRPKDASGKVRSAVEEERETGW